ncbi:OmpW family protein [Acetobacteraceae bacterium H6797]|nr:OmpW family protein [Acetobacteraceae bacterium H6797]
MLNKKTLMLAAASLAMATAGAQAEDFRIKQAGDLVIGFGAIGVLPDSGGSTSIGGKPHADDGASPQLDLTYFFTPNIAVNVIAATTRHSLQARNTALGDVELGHVWALPPILTLQYHPLPESRFSPYLGAGINYTTFYGAGGGTTAPVDKVAVKNAWGWALNAGVDYALEGNWALNFDVKKLFLSTDVSLNSGAVTGKVDLDPWIVGASVRYRF